MALEGCDDQGTPLVSTVWEELEDPDEGHMAEVTGIGPDGRVRSMDYATWVDNYEFSVREWHQRYTYSAGPRSPEGHRKFGSQIPT